MRKENFSERIIMAGYKTIVLGICLYIIELMLLPIFGFLQKEQVNGNGFYTEFWRYTGEQPYPTIFFLTGVIVVLGVILLYLGMREKKKNG
ncbi:hypothetical protein KHM83_01895 [Fusibacter paucivorans]|uniref:LPXTG-motif cell wall anchor domain-containing protein n=1 Tax=Fusibacter paucivorans TaxID=76009 RepID=A0ABS5PJV8_9FIRM|nr:hypothetical protein [Fusibacter paucivorans]MBS7525425.1 hypothetical protein [Fusibacter paucivorans]